MLNAIVSIYLLTEKLSDFRKTSWVFKVPLDRLVVFQDDAVVYSEEVKVVMKQGQAAKNG